jgi:hypothetical protein
MLNSGVLPRIHPMRLRIAKPFNDPDYIFELKHRLLKDNDWVALGQRRTPSTLLTMDEE